jgi:hypothetical protein
MNSRRRTVERRKIREEKREAGKAQAKESIKKASPGLGNLVPGKVGSHLPPSHPLGSRALHRQTSYTSESQGTASSIASKERQQSLRERAESMRGGISALEEVLLNENVPEEQRRAAQAELQQLHSMMAMLYWLEQSDWARGLVDEPPPAYNALLGR